MTRYADALAALIDRPTPEQLVRDRAPVRARLAELADEHLQHCRYLHERYLRAEVAGNIDGAERALCALTEAGARYRTRKAAISATVPEPPSLLEQLVDAVHGTGGTNGGGGAGPHRAQLQFDASALVTEIRRTIPVHHGPLSVDVDRLRHDFRCWRPVDELQAAAHLDIWVAAIRALLDPPKSLEGTRPCPACGRRFVRARQGDEWIRRSAIRIVIHPSGSPNDDYAECLSEACGERWPRARWNLLAAAMTTADSAG